MCRGIFALCAASLLFCVTGRKPMRLWWIGVLFFYMKAVLAQGAMCEATELGNPCQQGGVATLGRAQGSPNFGIGNPVDRRNGNKYQRDTDLPSLAKAPGLELVRHYNALDPRTGALGRGWSWSYDTRLYWMGARLQVLQADGSRLTFKCDSKQRCVGLAPDNGVIMRKGERWQWQWPFGKCLHFDEPGRLLGWSFATANKSGHLQGHCDETLAVQIVRHQAPSRWHTEIDRVTDTRSNKSLYFSYASTSEVPGTLVAVYSPLGIFRYVHAANGLIEVIRPDGMRRRYHHEAFLQAGNAHAVTGISLVDHTATQALRTHTWQYDRGGRVQKFAAGPPALLAAGLLTAVPDAALGLAIEQDVSRVIRHVSFNAIGWPGLRLSYDATGRLTQWHSRGVSSERLEYQQQHFLHERLERKMWVSKQDHLQHEAAQQANAAQRSQLVLRKFGEHDIWRWNFDMFGRVRTLTARSMVADPVEIRVAWRGRHPAVLAHPEETQHQRFSAAGDLRERVVYRRTTGSGLAKVFRPEWRYREAFTYDAKGRRLTHVLPEGGVLHYHWSPTTLRAIEWEREGGNRQKILEVGPLGLLHGNGLLTVRQMAASQAIEGEPAQLEQLLVFQPATGLQLYRHQIVLDPRARLGHESMTLAGQTYQTSYHYDGVQRLRRHRIWSSSSNRTSTREYAWRTSGEARQTIARDSTGLPTRIDRFLTRYNAQRRLTGVVEQLGDGQKVIYGHNALGERIWREDQHGRTQYLFDAQKMVAQGRDGKNGLRVQRRFIYLHHVPVALIEYGEQPTQATLYFFHTDAIGLPQFLTDAKQAIRWRATYSPLGALLEQHHDLGKDFEQPLRMPGQVADALTGWHDNYQRTYDPHWGHYLEPDPLGPLPGNSQYGYADQQPRRYVDPLGLLLVAFDGTGNSAISQTNVWLFAHQYRGGPVNYIEGPAGDLETGRAKHAWDAAFATSGKKRVDQQWERWLNAVALQREGAPPLSLDLIGFSRGAALVRDFGNRVVKQMHEGRFWSFDPKRGFISRCVDLRFMGLFDTVAQFNFLGSGNNAFDFTIAPAWKWVAHAVALHEHRWVFPLTSARGTKVEGNVVERAFVGAHADIGGGYLTREASPGSTPGDLSKVALAWMHWQAKAAGVPLGPGPSAASVTRPILHDERGLLSQHPKYGDRHVDQPDGKLWKKFQSEIPAMGSEVRQQVESLIARRSSLLPRAPDALGWVDMPRYTQWLRDEVGWHWD